MSKRYSIDLDPERCVACGACAVACMDQNDLEPKNGQDMFRKISVVERGSGRDTRFTYLSLACMHCNKAPCIEACPCGCLSKDPDTGFTVYDNTNCIGCRSCTMACPFAAPTFNEQGKMIKCDGCNERVKNGLEPACVRVCPFDALALVTEEERLARRKARSVGEIAAEICDQRHAT